MDIIRVNSESDVASALERALATLEAGGTVIYPTDTLYALGCNALNTSALSRVFDIKKRVYTAAVPVLVQNVVWARELVHIDNRGERIMTDFWPGQVTVVAKKKEMVPAMATGGGQTLGLRAPNHPFAQKLLAAFGYPLCGTSANLSGNRPSQDPQEIARIFLKASRRPDLMIDVGVLPSSEPSTVVEVTGAHPRIVRQGAVRADKLFSYLS